MGKYKIYIKNGYGNYQIGENDTGVIGIPQNGAPGTVYIQKVIEGEKSVYDNNHIKISKTFNLTTNSVNPANIKDKLPQGIQSAMHNANVSFSYMGNASQLNNGVTTFGDFYTSKPTSGF